MTRHHILAEIRLTALENGGKALGAARFEQQTGIRNGDWFGKYWKSWGDALQEAGFTPNTLQGRIAEDHLLEQYVKLVRELGRVPVKGDLLLRRRADPTFPNEKVFTRRFGLKARLRSRIRDYCLAQGGLDDVVAILETNSVPEQAEETPPRVAAPAFGFVYLLKSGRHYKIGRTNSVGRRGRELEIQLPEKAGTIHVIKTDDPPGIEAYWHARFAAKRGRKSVV